MLKDEKDWRAKKKEKKKKGMSYKISGTALTSSSNSSRNFFTIASSSPSAMSCFRTFFAVLNDLVGFIRTSYQQSFGMGSKQRRVEKWGK